MMSLPSDALIGVEFYVMLIVSLAFSLLYEWQRDLTFAGIIAAMAWLIMGMYYFVVFASNPSAAFGLFFSGIGIIYIVRFMADLISMRHASRRLAGDERW